MCIESKFIHITYLILTYCTPNKRFILGKDLPGLARRDRTCLQAINFATSAKS